MFPELIHAADDAGYVIHSAGGIAAGSLIIAASLVFARGGLLPSWFGPVGVVVGIIGLFSIFFFPQFLVALWFLLAGWVVYRAAASVEPIAPPPAATPPAGPIVP